MELLTLNSSYQPSELVERYSSLIWTERYLTSGDFQLISTDVSRMIKLLPLESLVTIRESTVPMLVESHKIEKPKNSAPSLTVKGRSFESVLERRAAVKFAVAGVPGARVTWVELRNKPSDAAYQAIRQIIGDVERSSVPLSAQTPIVSLNDALPMVDLIVPADYSTGILNEYEIKPGSLYSAVLELLAINHHGIKSVRPVTGANKIAIEIYNGADLTIVNDPNAVAFDAKFDQFEDATYLLSEQGSYNRGYVFSKTAFSEISKTAAPEPVGLARRVLYVDASAEGGLDTAETRRTKGLLELYKYNATALFDGRVAEQVAEGYNRDYFLGDIIRLDGEYGLSQNVRVSEFIHSDDNTGSKSFPTFELITE